MWGFGLRSGKVGRIHVGLGAIMYSLCVYIIGPGVTLYDIPHTLNNHWLFHFGLDSSVRAYTYANGHISTPERMVGISNSYT